LLLLLLPLFLRLLLLLPGATAFSPRVSPPVTAAVGPRDARWPRRGVGRVRQGSGFALGKRGCEMGGRRWRLRPPCAVKQ
jgi:hypothetical protein